MKKFLLNIGLFVVVIAALAVVGDYVISSGLCKTTIRKYAVWNDIYNGNNLDNDLVLLGASSCWAHYNPMILDSILGISTYNLGIDNHPWYPMIPIRYNAYIRNARINPKYVLINIDIGTFNSKTDSYEREQFFPYFWKDNSLITQVADCKEFTWIERYIPIWRYLGYRDEVENGIASFFGKKKFKDDGVYKGHRGNTYAWDRASLNTMDSISLEYNYRAVESLLQFITERKNEGQVVILLKTPVYHELQDRLTDREDMCARYDSIARVSNVILLDYLNHPVVQDSIYFYNSTHLNKRGADIISCQLAHDIDSLGILK